MPRPLMRSPLLEELPTPEQAAVSRSGLVLELSLKTITPVLGGGVKPFELDQVDIVRAPSIRGHLRWWWRRLFHEPGETAADLFRKEAALWGGVGKGVGGKGVGAVKSRVRILVVDAKGSPPRPAGHHELGVNKKLKAAPKWELGPDVGYALFPLQLKDSERKDRFRGSRLPTRDLRHSLDFKLRIELEPRAGEEGACSALRLLAALWCWIHLGGYGARTRRGFGALALSETPKLSGDLVSHEVAAWRELFDPKGKLDFYQRLGGVMALCERLANSAWWRCLLVSPTKNDPSAAHADAVGALKRFRQGRGVGRDDPSPGSSSPAGISRWPEPNLLRLLRNALDGKHPWEHPPPEDLVEVLAEMGVPRAAFGMPILFHFKEEPGKPNIDSRANAEVQPLGAERWASPLLVRPICWKGNDFRALVLVLTEQAPKEVRVLFDFQEELTPRPEYRRNRLRETGSRGDIQVQLAASSADALAAYTSWLQESPRSYQELHFDASAGGSHA